MKYGTRGLFRGGAEHSAWLEPAAVSEISPAAVDATIAYCEYIHARYARFPAYIPPFRTVLGFQACHLDSEFYDRFYRAEALSETERLSHGPVARDVFSRILDIFSSTRAELSGF